MKQVGFRQEAARLGGIGSCGRELCCSTWLTDFRSVNTSAARYQQLSLNPQKLAGQCGKLKCCLNYELDTYMDALKDFPEFETKLVTEKGDAVCQKQDIFKGLMWFAYTNNYSNWHILKIEQVKEIIAENKLKNKVSSLEDYAIEVVAEPEQNFNNAMGQESLTRFDQPKRKKKPTKKPRIAGEKAITPAITKNANKQPLIQKNNPANVANENVAKGESTVKEAQNANKNRNKNNNRKKTNPNKPATTENKIVEPRKPIIIKKNESNE